MIKRTLLKNLQMHAKKLPIIALTGPRQSGKTTLVKAAFPNYTYQNLEFPDVRARAIEDPRLFLKSFKNGLILDEVQRVPELFSYIQGLVDENPTPGRFILTGSHNFMLLEKISQSLAGRVSLFNLLPFSLAEIHSQYPLSESYEPTLLMGGYPRLYDQHLQPQEWYPSYIQSYIERDVRQIVNVKDINKFQIFIKICAGRIGQIFNASSVATEVGVDHKTIQQWLSVLQASFIIYLLQPFHKNFNKRLLKTPKLYFYDTGLACSLLGIRNEHDMHLHFLKGEIFENFIISELIKYKINHSSQMDFYFWRDNSGNEIDCLAENGTSVKAIEIKSGTTLNSRFFKGLEYWQRLTNEPADNCTLVYGGTETQQRKQGKVIGWKDITEIIS